MQDQDRYIVNVEYVEKLIEECRRINALDISKVTWTKEGRNLDIPSKIIEEWKFTGLNNIDFIRNGFYMNGFEEETPKA